MGLERSVRLLTRHSLPTCGKSDARSRNPVGLLTDCSGAPGSNVTHSLSDMAIPVRELIPAPAAEPPPAPPSTAPPLSGWRRARRVATIAALISLMPAAVSFAGALAKTSNSSLGIRAVEWLKDNGARGFVNTIESIWYSLTAP